MGLPLTGSDVDLTSHLSEQQLPVLEDVVQDSSATASRVAKGSYCRGLPVGLTSSSSKYTMSFSSKNFIAALIVSYFAVNIYLINVVLHLYAVRICMRFHISWIHN